MIEFLCLGVSFGMFFFLGKSRFNYLMLGRLPVATGGPAPDVTVIVPCRDEAHQVADAISGFASVPVLVVDDHSTDGTAQAASKAGATVISAPPLAAGWLGKPNACAAGAAACATKWLLFVDGDTKFDPRFVNSAVRYAEQNRFDLLTAFLEQRRVTLFEKMLLPYAFALYFCGVSARSVNRAKGGAALANGQCILFRREAYEQIGGHGAVRGSVIEDAALAALAKRAGLSIRVVRAEHLGSVRMYNSLRAIWRGFQKNSFRFLLVNPGGGIQVVTASILLALWLPLLVAVFASYPALLLLLAPSLTLFPWYAEGKAGQLWQVLLAPAAIYLFQAIALHGMLTTLLRRKSVWKGRHV